jgi:hypothetical protein
MSSFASSTRSISSPSTLAPLVRTNHIDHDPDLTDEGAAYQETYIIEPQSGDIYVMATPSSPLQRFPFSMSELVNMSPFSFASADDHRVFFGRKETSLLVVELETGNIKATINSACPWDPFEDLREGDDEVDLDELEGSKPPMSKPTEVFIGRTGMFSVPATLNKKIERWVQIIISASTHGRRTSIGSLSRIFHSRHTGRTIKTTSFRHRIRTLRMMRTSRVSLTEKSSPLKPEVKLNKILVQIRFSGCINSLIPCACILVVLS